MNCRRYFPPKLTVLLAVSIVLFTTSINSPAAQGAVVCTTLVGQASGSNQTNVQRGARRKYDAMRKAENIRAGFRPVGRPFTRCRRSSGRYTCVYSRKVCSGT